MESQRHARKTTVDASARARLRQVLERAGVGAEEAARLAEAAGGGASLAEWEATLRQWMGGLKGER